MGIREREECGHEGDEEGHEIEEGEKIATTDDDWTYVKFLTAITTGGDIPIDINAQTIGNIDIDISEASIGTLDIDITAVTFGTLDVDIVAQAVGDIAVDINAQTVGDINIDLNAQSVNRIIIRDNDGGIECSSGTQTNIGTGSTATFLTDTGAGSLRWVYFTGLIQTHDEYFTPIIEIDGTKLLPSEMLTQFNVYNHSGSTPPFCLLKYAVGGVCVFMCYWEKGIVFDTSIAIKGLNGSPTNTITWKAQWFYQKL